MNKGLLHAQYDAFTNSLQGGIDSVMSHSNPTPRARASFHLLAESVATLAPDNDVDGDSDTDDCTRKMVCACAAIPNEHLKVFVSEVSQAVAEARSKTPIAGAHILCEKDDQLPVGISALWHVDAADADYNPNTCVTLDVPPQNSLSENELTDDLIVHDVPRLLTPRQTGVPGVTAIAAGAGPHDLSETDYKQGPFMRASACGSMVLWMLRGSMKLTMIDYTPENRYVSGPLMLPLLTRFR